MEKCTQYHYKVLSGGVTNSKVKLTTNIFPRARLFRVNSLDLSTRLIEIWKKCICDHNKYSAAKGSERRKRCKALLEVTSASAEFIAIRWTDHDF